MSAHFAELHRVFDLLHFLQSVLDHLLNICFKLFQLSLNIRTEIKTKTESMSASVLDGMMNLGPYLFLPTLPLHWDSVVTAVVSLGAEHTHTPLVAPAEQLQEPLVPFAHPALQRRHRFNQLVNLQSGNSQVWLQVTLAV